MLMPSKPRKNNDKIKDLMIYIHQHYGEKISVSEVAASAYLSERECFRIFQECLHMTPMQYIQNYRLQMGLPDAWRNQGFGYGDQPCVRFGKQQLFWKSVSGIYEMYASGVQKKVRSCLKNRKLFSKYVSKYAID